MQREITQEEIDKHLPGAARVALAVMESWGLTDDESRQILNLDHSTFQTLKEDAARVGANEALLMRIGHVLGIRKSLEILFSTERGRVVENPFVKRSNKFPTFGGRTPLELMMQEDPEGLATVRLWLEGHVWN